MFERVLRQIVLFFFAFGLWMLLVWPFDPLTGKIVTSDIGAGLICALIVAVVMREVTLQLFGRWLNPIRIFWLVLYFFILIFYIIKANIDVAYRVLHPDMPIHPGIVKVKTSLTSATAITFLANSITLTPGTLTVQALSDGTMYIHWINVQTTDSDKATEYIVRRFEWFIQKVFE
jgi:multicomponent Na+:H+ antiporter subunit E